MRYYIGLGVGHTYGWSQKTKDEALQDLDLGPDDPDSELVQAEEPDDDSESINSMDRGLDSSDEIEGVNSEDEIESDDEEFYAQHEMYHE